MFKGKLHPHTLQCINAHVMLFTRRKRALGQGPAAGGAAAAAACLCELAPPVLMCCTACHALLK
jgi:hypothetical protein